MRRPQEWGSVWTLLLLFGAVLLCCSCTTGGRGRRSQVECAVKGDQLVVRIVNYGILPFDFFLLADQEYNSRSAIPFGDGVWSRIPFGSAVFVRADGHQPVECKGALLEDDPLVLPVRMRRVAPHSAAEYVFRLEEILGVHRPRLAQLFPTKPWGLIARGDSVDDLRAAKVQYKICITVYLDPGMTRSATCETDWQNF